MRVITCLAVDHDLRFVALAALICICGCYVTFDLIERAQDRTGKQKAGWIFLAAVAGGCSIWCTHFVAMMAYRPPAAITFDPIITLLSLLISIAGSGAGIWFALSDRSSNTAPAIGGAFVGLGISAMHYTGMAGFRIHGEVDWNQTYIVASVILSMIFAAAAILTFLRRPWPNSHYASLALLVVAIVSLHFTGMAALTVQPSAVTDITLIELEQLHHAIAVAVAGVAFIVVTTSIASHLIDSEASFETIRRLQALALNDTLTSLPNRISFHNTVTELLARAETTGRHVAVLGIDLDRFKEINDLRGHDAGDRTLKILAARLKNLLTDGEHAARIGGDEFSCVKIYRSQLELVNFVRRVEAALHQPFVLDDLETVSGASIGIANYPHDGNTPERLMSNADMAMFRAKSDPTRAVCYYEANMDETARDRVNMAIELRSAIANNELMLHYQVQKDLRTGDTTGYEVLLRWNHPVRGSVSPAVFIPVAEETGSIMAIGAWVLRAACAEAVTWPEPHKIAVNISPAQLSHIDLAELVHDILLQTGLDPKRLELEMTETAIVQHKTRALEHLRRLQEIGVTIAIDDFGTGYSSLETLRSFPFNKIKLDRSFMPDIGTDQQATAIIRAVLALGKSLDITVLAEGVETQEQLQTLHNEGCSEAQGFFFGRPAPREEQVPPAVVDAA